jgi:hypothetical protein
MRIFFKDGSNILEITKQINKYKSDTYLLTMTSSDAIYIATDFPMNHLFIKMGAVLNESSSSMLIDYWSSQGWLPVVNHNDYTNAFSESGFVEFTPDINHYWTRSNTSSPSQSITGLESIVVYEKYWTRIQFTNDLDPNIELEWIGSKFSDDDDLYSEYPIFNDQTFLTVFSAGKTDWEEQHIKAADLIVQDLKKKNVILGKEQILDRSVMLPASVCKVAEIIFNAFGRDYNEQKLAAKLEYERRIDLSNYVVDTNNNGVEDAADVQYKQGWLTR